MISFMHWPVHLVAVSQDWPHGWSDDEIRAIAAPTLFTVGDSDMVKLDHEVKFLLLDAPAPAGWADR